MIIMWSSYCQSLSAFQVFRIAYCDFFSRSDEMKCRDVCKTFVDEVYTHYPEFRKKKKIHLILHLTDCMLALGPTCGFNTERYVQFVEFCSKIYHWRKIRPLWRCGDYLYAALQCVIEYWWWLVSEHFGMYILAFSP